MNCRLLKAKDAVNGRITLKALEGKLPMMLKLLRNDDDDVSAAVATLAHDYLAVLKQLCPLNAMQKEFVLVSK